jgi:hypothetical protein
MTLISIYGSPFAGTSPWRMEVKSNEYVYQRNETYSSDIPWNTPLITGKWMEVLTHEKFGNEGSLEIWFNGNKLRFFSPGSWNPSHYPETEKLEMETMDSSNNEGLNSVRIGQYRQVGMFETATVYYEFVKVGTTRESVGG